MEKMYGNTLEKMYGIPGLKDGKTQIVAGHRVTVKATPEGPMAWAEPIEKQGYKNPPETGEHPLQMFDRIFDAGWEHIKMDVYSRWNDMQNDSFEGTRKCFRFKYMDKTYYALVSNKSKTCNCQLTIRISGVDFVSLPLFKSSASSVLVKYRPGCVILDEAYDQAFPCVLSLVDACTKSRPTYFYDKEGTTLELKAWTATTPDMPSIGLAVIFEGVDEDRYYSREHDDVLRRNDVPDVAESIRK